MSKQDSDPEHSGAPPADPGGETAPVEAPASLSGMDIHLRHALRTPLNHIIGYSELLLEETRERGLDDLTADLDKILAAAGELLTLMDDPARSGIPETQAAPPVVEAAAAPAMEDSDDTQASGGSGPAGQARLLVVDDNAGNRDVVTRLLESEGYTVSQAENGLDALELVESESFDLILMDVMMPVMDGVEACRRLKQDPHTRLIPVVIMTALGQLEHRVQGIRAGADDFLTKPVNRSELLARIQTSLGLKQAMEDKLGRLKEAQEYLARFVPQSVVRELERNPDAPGIDKTEQDLSALFVDVSGYTRLSESMRQAADYMVEKYFSRYLDVIHARGGDVTETSGDGLMVVFPGTEPAEHAVNAVHAGLELLQKTRELNRQLEGIFDPIHVHIGINSGITLVGPTKYEGASGVRWVYTALGPPVNLAARIAGVADAGMICIGPETARRVQGHFPVRELGRRQLKNVRDEIMIHQVVPSAED